MTIRRKKTVYVSDDGIIEIYVSFSSAISRISWKDNKLAVRFSSGALYRYENIPLSIVQQLVTSFSIGSSFDELIKKSDYTYTRIA